LARKIRQTSTHKVSSFPILLCLDYHFIKTFSFLHLTFEKCFFFNITNNQLTIFSLNRTTEAGVPAFKKHIDQLIKDWKRVYLLNLLSKKKKEEELLTAEYERQLVLNFFRFIQTPVFFSKSNEKIFVQVLYKGLNQKIIKYFAFDYSAICEKKAKNVYQLIKEIGTCIKEFGWYSERGDKRTFQTGIFRTNCLDCLDRYPFTQLQQSLFFDLVINNLAFFSLIDKNIRTNAVQTEIALEILKLQLQNWKMETYAEKKRNEIKETKKKRKKGSFLDLLETMWVLWMLKHCARTTGKVFDTFGMPMEMLWRVHITVLIFASFCF
jgi:hypothetical protein